MRRVNGTLLSDAYEGLSPHGLRKHEAAADLARLGSYLQPQSPRFEEA